MTPNPSLEENRSNAPKHKKTPASGRRGSPFRSLGVFVNYVQWLKKNPPMPQIVGVAMLGWALIPANPYGYYILLRVILCGIFVFLAVKAHELKHVGWVWVLAINAVLYNPFIRVHLNRENWSVVNLTTIGLLIATVFVLREKTE